MKTTKMLKKNYEFKKVLSKGRCYSEQNIKAVILKNYNNDKKNFLGLAISKKFGKAVNRNKVKRLFRENYKNLEENIEHGYSIVFLVKNGVTIKQINYNEIKEEMIKIFRKSNILKQ